MTRQEEIDLAIDEASSVAIWAHIERDRLNSSLWTWARRRFLRRVFEAKCAEVDRLRAALAVEEAKCEGMGV